MPFLRALFLLAFLCGLLSAETNTPAAAVEQTAPAQVTPAKNNAVTNGPRKVVLQSPKEFLERIGVKPAEPEEKNSQPESEEKVTEDSVKAPDKEDNPVQKELNARDDRRADREIMRSERDTKGVETYVDRTGWETADGFATMEDYVKRLKKVFETRMAGLVEKVAGGKKGILLVVNEKAKRNFFLAQENTSELLSVIVDDLRRMPEPILLQVTVDYRNVPIIVAYSEKGEIKVEYLK